MGVRTVLSPTRSSTKRALVHHKLHHIPVCLSCVQGPFAKNRRGEFVQMTESKHLQGIFRWGHSRQRKLFGAGWALGGAWREAEKMGTLQRGAAQEQAGSFTRPGSKWAPRPGATFSPGSPDTEKTYDGVLGRGACPGPTLPCGTWARILAQRDQGCDGGCLGSGEGKGALDPACGHPRRLPKGGAGPAEVGAAR